MPHKALFPLDINDYVGTFLIMLAMIIAASGGIGGGGMVVPLVILVYGFSPREAIPLANFTILGSALANISLNIWKRHPLVNKYFKI
jgi:uncharacterized membrane protein YfcA